MKVRIGIDVGGTFTDVVVIDQQTRELVGQLKLPTTHDAREGVALGIVTALRRALEEFNLAPDDVAFIAHSTTQATNALLEGDVAKVAVLAAGEGVEGWLARWATQVPPIELARQRSLAAQHVWLGADGLLVSGAPGNQRELERLGRVRGRLVELLAAGIEVAVVSVPFGVDQPDTESEVVAVAREAGLFATSGHEVSRLYGLRVRTRTAVINAAILPKMIGTAEMTERCVRETGIDAPLMIMRSDGGVMGVAEVQRRPILTMLSGPAAGIAGALMHERISDGIFIEVGGTSADISVIRDGSPATRPARLNGHRMYLDTLDVRTQGVGGGSLIRIRGDADRSIVDVGPRSAHIAGLRYACFIPAEELTGATVEIIRPTARDEQDHLAIRTVAGEIIALTTTCAANLLGLVGTGHFAHGRPDSARLAFGQLAAWQGQKRSGEDLAGEVLRLACRTIETTIEDLIIEYQLPRDQVVLVGGGGGAAALVPFLANQMGLEHRIARNAEVISPIGVAMAMVRDTVERNIVDPTPEQILAVRREATAAAVNAGAVPGTIEVQVEVDRRRNLVRAVAVGTTELRPAVKLAQVSQAECQQAAARSMRVAADQLTLLASTAHYLVFATEHRTKSFFSAWRSPRPLLRVVDRTGVVRLQRNRARVTVTTPHQLDSELARAVDALTDFGDAGRTIPDIFILNGARVINFSGLTDLEQVVALARVELRSIEPDEELVVIACPKQV